MVFFKGLFILRILSQLSLVLLLLVLVVSVAAIQIFDFSSPPYQKDPTRAVCGAGSFYFSVNYLRSFDPKYFAELKGFESFSRVVVCQRLAACKPSSICSGEEVVSCSTARSFLGFPADSCRHSHLGFQSIRRRRHRHRRRTSPARRSFGRSHHYRLHGPPD